MQNNFYPTTIYDIDDFIEFMERLLGGEGHTIELTRQNWLDIITRAMNKFYRYFSNEALVFKRYIIELWVNKEEYKMDELLIYEKQQDGSGKFKLKPIEPNLFNVVSISPFRNTMMVNWSSGTGNFMADYMLFYSGNSNDGRTPMDRVGDALNVLRDFDYIKKLFQTRYTVTYNKANNSLMVYPTPKVTGFTILEVYEKIQISKLLNNDFFQDLVEAFAYEQWAKNLYKYGSREIDGGGRLDPDRLFSLSEKLLNRVEQKMLEEREPMDFFVD